VVELPERPVSLQPPKDLLHPLPATLAHLIPGMARRPTVEGTAPLRRHVLGDVRGDPEGAAAVDEGGTVIALVGAKGHAVVAGEGGREGERGGGLRSPDDPRGLRLDHEAMPVLHEHVPR